MEKVKTEMGIWKPATGAWSNGEELWLGTIKVGGAIFNPMRPKGDPLGYQASILLPGIRLRQADFKTMEEAKDAVSSGVCAWFRIAAP